MLKKILLAALLSLTPALARAQNGPVLRSDLGFAIGGVPTSSFTASGSFIPPAGVYMVRAVITGAGAGGGGTDSNIENQGGGGGGGGQTISVLVPVTPGVAVPVTIGAGGLGGIAYLDGGNGGATSFGNFISTGGIGGSKGDATNNGGNGGGGPMGGFGNTTNFGGFGTTGTSVLLPAASGSWQGGGGGGGSRSAQGQLGGNGGGASYAPLTSATSGQTYIATFNLTVVPASKSGSFTITVPSLSPLAAYTVQGFDMSVVSPTNYQIAKIYGVARITNATTVNIDWTSDTTLVSGVFVYYTMTLGLNGYTGLPGAATPGGVGGNFGDGSGGGSGGGGGASLLAAGGAGGNSSSTLAVSDAANGVDGTGPGAGGGGGGAARGGAPQTTNGGNGKAGTVQLYY